MPAFALRLLGCCVTLGRRAQHACLRSPACLSVHAVRVLIQCVCAQGYALLDAYWVDTLEQLCHDSQSVVCRVYRQALKLLHKLTTTSPLPY